LSLIRLAPCFPHFALHFGSRVVLVRGVESPDKAQPQQPINAEPSTEAAQSADQLAEAVLLLRRIAEALDVGEPEGLSPAAAARYCGVSVSQWHSLDNAGKVPAASYLSDRTPRWSRYELRAWLIEKCPERMRWQAMRSAAMRKIG
jgi:hypothetical protein